MTALPLPVESPATIEHLDEDWALPCEVYWSHPEVAEAPRAEWIVWSVCSCPPGYFLFCSPCLDVMLADRTTVECVGCLAKWCPPSTAVRLIEPLNRRPHA